MRSEREISPVFTSRAKAVGVLALAAFALLFPFMPKPAFLERAVLYTGMISNPWVRNTNRANYQMLMSRGPVDICVLGPSTTANAIDPVLLKRLIHREIGRSPEIFTISHRGYSIDFDYVILRDLLLRRKVRMLIWSRTREADKVKPDASTNYLWDMRLHWPAIRALDRNNRIDIYFFSVMNGLRLLTSPICDRLPMAAAGDDRVRNLGAYLERTPRSISVGVPPVLTLGQLVHHRGDGVVQERGEYSRFERTFSDEILRLAAANGVTVVMIQVPYELQGQPTNRIIIPHMAPGQLGADLPIIAPTVADLYPNRNLDDIRKTFFRDVFHMHRDAADYFTRAIYPAVIDLYRRAVAPDLGEISNG